jgi:hypothetical protein
MPSRTRAAPGPELTLSQLNRTTLLRQSLLERSASSAAEAVGRLAGLQAQHANSPYVALWSRVDGFTIAALEAALIDRSVVKATLMRSTLHLVSGKDVAAFDAAGSEGRVANWRPTATRAGVDIPDLHRQLLAYAAEPRTVAEMEDFVASVLPETRFADHAPSGVRRVAYRLASAPGRLVHVPPSGLWASHGRPRYIDLGVWLPDSVAPGRDAALHQAAERYLTAYGPASIADFAKWVGQSRMPKARAAIAAFGDRIRRYVGPDGRELVDLDGLPVASGDEVAPGRFLARWDSVVIGYDVRDRILPNELFHVVVRIKNGDFLPTFTIDGFVAGSWAVETTRGEAVLTLTPAVPVPSRTIRAELSEEAERLVRFVAADATRHEVRWAKT